jgi:hypothetical protein
VIVGLPVGGTSYLGVGICLPGVFVGEATERGVNCIAPSETDRQAARRRHDAHIETRAYFPKFIM